MPVSKAEYDVLSERSRQVLEEGWDAAHDDEHTDGGMAIAAACYALIGTSADRYLSRGVASTLWGYTGWATSWFKPKTIRRNLVRAAALLIAEIERIDRAEARRTA